MPAYPIVSREYVYIYVISSVFNQVMALFLVPQTLLERALKIMLPHSLLFIISLSFNQALDPDHYGCRVRGHSRFFQICDNKNPNEFVGCCLFDSGTLVSSSTFEYLLTARICVGV